jgi:hypothetical protein
VARAVTALSRPSLHSLRFEKANKGGAGVVTVCGPTMTKFAMARVFHLCAEI